jgi:outer membrane autotransporter protein
MRAGTRFPAGRQLLTSSAPLTQPSAGRCRSLLVSTAIVALVCTAGAVQPAYAQSYTVGTTSDLTSAITDTNNNNYYSPTLTLSGNVTTPSGTVAPTATSPGTGPGNVVNLVTGASTLTLSGAGTVWNAGTFDTFNVSGSGSGGLTVSNGAQLVIPDNAAASQPGFLSFNSGALTVTGSGSSVTTDYFNAGRGGDATITLTNGGQITSSTTAIGECCGNTVAANITVLVDGAGTVWNAGYFSAGGATNNVNVTVSNGATIQAADQSGIGINGAGTMLVTGADSSFVDSGALYIGAYTYGGEGQGTLTISNGALVSASAVFVGVNDPGATGALIVNTNGILETGSLSPDVGSGTVDFDDGILRATAASSPGADLISGFTPGQFTLGAGGMFLDSNGFDVTASSVMSGVGGLTKQGAGALTLTADNTYTGGTTISAGTLQLGDGGVSGSIQGDVTNNGVLAFNRSDNGLMLSGVVSGSGSVNQIGSGTTTLTGANTYTGGTTISMGTLQLGNGGATGGIVGDVTDNGALVFDRSDVVTFGGVISGTGALGQIGSGTLILTGANSYAGGTTVSSGVLQLGNGGTGGSIQGDVVVNGALAFDRSDVVTFAGAISGGGMIGQIGSGTTVISGASSAFFGQTQVMAGTLEVDGVLGGAMQVLHGGRLTGVGQVGPTTNTGVIAPGAAGFGILTVAGGYAGQGGVLDIKARLGGDASPASRLVVTGATSGFTPVTVTNVGGAGAQTQKGIEVVQVTGASGGQFTLANGDYVVGGRPAVVAGAYGYVLQKDPADGGWYLRSSLLASQLGPNAPQVQPGAPISPGGPTVPLYQPGVPIYEAYAGMLLSLSQAPTLRERVGDRRYDPTDADQEGMWARVEGTTSHLEPLNSVTGVHQDIDSWKTQFGIDRILLGARDGARVVGGLNAQFGTADAQVSSAYGGGGIDIRTYGLGATLTWYGPHGVYVDAQAQAVWYQSDLSSKLAGRLAAGDVGHDYGLSVETGEAFPVTGALSVTPQAQLSYAQVGFGNFDDRFGANVDSDRGDNLLGRVGLELDHKRSWQDSTGQTRQLSLYGIVNFKYEFLDGTSLLVSGTPFASREGRNWGGFGAGGNYSWCAGRYSVYGEATADTDLSGFGDSYRITATAGFRMNF